MLWITLIGVIWQLRPAFNRERTFYWFIIAIIGFCTRGDVAGVTSFIRSAYIDPKYYGSLCRFFSSRAVNLEKLTRMWAALCLKIFKKFLYLIDDHIVLICDGIKIPKEGKKMPGVKSLHQDSQSNSKKEYIMGHSFQVISLLVGTMSYFFAVPLAARIHEGFVLSNRDKRTLYDKLILLFEELHLHKAVYLVADAYYSCAKMAKGLMKNMGHLITRVKKTSVAYISCSRELKANGKYPVGAPRKYGEKIKLINVFSSKLDYFESILSPVYGENGIEIKYFSMNLLWRPLAKIVRFVWVIHPSRGKIILFSSDITLSPIKILEIYGLRFKIEVGFKAAVQKIGSYCYHFWMKSMDNIKRCSGDQYLHKKDDDYRAKFLEKIRSYNVHVQIGVIAQGLLQYLSLAYTKLVWKSFGGWLRTIREDVFPSESVVATALTGRYFNFLIDGIEDSSFNKFLKKRIDPYRIAFNKWKNTG